MHILFVVLRISPIFSLGKRNIQIIEDDYIDFKDMYVPAVCVLPQEKI